MTGNNVRQHNMKTSKMLPMLKWTKTISSSLRTTSNVVLC